jgi:glycosyltransferase involved in cell wall biosynthesis
MAQVLREQRMSYDVGIWSRGVDTDIFSPARRNMAWRRSLGIADDEPVIGFIGRVVMEKGLDVFAETIDLLRRRNVRARVLVIGDGPARPWFESRLPANAVFVGFQRGEDLGRAVASSDILLNPSVTETFGNVTLEAMACGLPVVAARATGSLSLVEDGVTGRLIRPGANEQFAQALQLYCEDLDARTAAGAAGRAVSERYSWDAVNHALIEGYLRVIRHRQAGGQPVSRPR